jgi:hypothetical protein
MDYLNVGANGFAQVGDPEYFRKNKIEMSYLLELILSKFPVPAELTGIYCYFMVKAFPHDFGTYHEIVLVYDDSKIEEWETSEDEVLNELHDSFWNWFNIVESFDLESEEITEQIKNLYLKSLDKEKGEHLKVARA